MFVLLRDGSQLGCDAHELVEACRFALRYSADLLDDGRPVDCLCVLGLDRPQLFAAPRVGQLRPTPAEVRAMVAVLGMTGAEVSRLTGTSPRKVRAWIGGEDGAPWAAWHIMAVYVGLSEPMLGVC